MALGRRSGYPVRVATSKNSLNKQAIAACQIMSSIRLVAEYFFDLLDPGFVDSRYFEE